MSIGVIGRVEQSLPKPADPCEWISSGVGWFLTGESPLEPLASLSQLAPYGVDRSIKNHREDEFWVPIAIKSHQKVW
ncbi:hypothetical protein NPIL_161481 [Nephila pilipes]|uniref:Uncharacterized protein n=1 Tax=Nephila pilipes TaxID=299642 RepID=A0A8X6UMV6_NEPPI|nr:hypothetical protein NPIL_161481 [Nephila pilipes]